MRRLLHTVRILTVLSYFLPFIFFFTTCRGFNLYFAYNKKQAAINEAIREPQESSGTPSRDSTNATDSTMSPADSTGLIYGVDSAVTDVKTDTATSISEKIFWSIMAPTNTSLSGIGIVWAYYADQNFFMAVAIAISILLSLSIMIISFFRKYNKRLLFILQCINLLCILSFILQALFTNVTVLFGAWMNFSLIIAGLVLYYKQSQKAKDG